MAEVQPRSRNRKGGISIADVAELAGTSIATVSRVLANADHPVAARTRKTVLDAAESLGYHPNAIARALATQRTRTIGLIVGDISDVYFAQIARGVEDTAEPHGYLTIICNADRNPDKEVAYFNMLLEHKVAAIVLSGGFFSGKPGTKALQPVVARAVAEGRRVVALGSLGFPGVATISVDNVAVCHDITRYLIQLGHRRIAFVGGPEGLSTSIEREQGFRRAMEEAGLEASMVYREGFGFDAGRRAAVNILLKSLPEAVVAATDESAIGLMAAFREAGIDVPGDVSISGIDNSDLSALLGLTTVKVPKYELGKQAAQMLLDSAEDGEILSTTLPHRIVMRGSTAFRNAPQQKARKTSSLRSFPSREGSPGD